MNTCGPVNGSAPAVAQRDQRTYCYQLEQLQIADYLRLL
jgi:hypothetical protein